jgi:hypothetical protein
MTTKPELSEDALTILGLGSTAVAYAASPDEEVERWLHAVRPYGRAGAALRRIDPEEGDAPAPAGHASATEQRGADGEQRAAAVLAAAQNFALERSATSTGTVDVLLAVMHVYGPALDRTLARKGTDRLELVELLGSGDRGGERRPRAS